MIRGNALLVIGANGFTLAAIGCCYAQLLQLAMSAAAAHLPQAITSSEKMLITGTCTAVAVAVVFALNWLMTRQNMLALGVVCGAMAFIYFYIVRSWPLSIYRCIGSVFVVQPVRAHSIHCDSGRGRGSLASRI